MNPIFPHPLHSKKHFFSSGPYLSREGLFLKTVFTILTSSTLGLSVGSAFVVAYLTAAWCLTRHAWLLAWCLFTLAWLLACCWLWRAWPLAQCLLRHVTVGLMFVETYVTVGMVFAVTCMAAGLAAVPSVGFCALLTTQGRQNQTLLLFGILFLPRHDKRKNISSGQSPLVNFSSLSLLLATVLQVQIEFIFRASLITLADCCFDPHQYQVLKIASIPKHDKWNCWMVQSGLQHLRVPSSISCLQ